MAELHPNASINLEGAAVLLLDDNPEGMNILVQILTAFGVKSIHRCRSVADARKRAAAGPLDLVLASATLRNSSGYDFTSWLRRSGNEINAFTPVILVSGHTQPSDVQKARDCGANFIVTKPLIPAVLLERIVWVAREKRPFVLCDVYVGPERRSEDRGPPPGLPRRRRGEHARTAGDADMSDFGTKDIPAASSKEPVT